MNRTDFANIMRDYAMSFIGQPYRWGGDDPVNGFDCSGLAQEILASVGADPEGDQTADQLHQLASKSWRPCTIDEVGGIAFYGNDERATHVAIQIGGGLMIEAGGGGSRTITKEDAATQNAFVRIRPVKRRKDHLGSFDPLTVRRAGA